MPTPPNIVIGQSRIGLDAPVFVIAEVGVNHNGSLDMALELIRAAKHAGADCVKFQTFKSDRVVSADAPKADYQLKVTDRAESQIDMLRKLELSEDAYPRLIALCEELGILFSSTPYNEEDIAQLNALDVPILKAASIHCVEPHFLKVMAETRRPVILSTGMATWEDVDRAVAAIRATGNEQFVVLQCTTNYPSDVADANLRTMVAMAERYGCLVGYSDHTLSHAPCVASVALGARVIERHFTLDTKLPGPDHSSSDTPESFARLVGMIRDAEKALGSAVKQPTAAERKNMTGMRRSIFSRRDIPAGKTIEDADLICKRPSTGIAPSTWDELVGRRAVRAITAGEMLSVADFDG
jgi:N-acetylneuraminate synthase/N,N'-diacetyllegionaminate synthase